MSFLPLPSFAPEHLHPMLVNFTAAMVPASLGSDLAGRILRRPSLTASAWWMLVYATAITPLTALAGFWWKKRVNDALTPKLVAQHQWLGLALVASFVVLLLWRRSAYRVSGPPSWAYLTFAAVLVVALVLQGVLGGAMLFGS